MSAYFFLQYLYTDIKCSLIVFMFLNHVPTTDNMEYQSGTGARNMQNKNLTCLRLSSEISALLYACVVET
jgi:hypothetical protein